MKKNILTIIIMAISLINTVLLGLIIFTIVPTAIRTNALVGKVASVIDLELESKKTSELSVEDIATHEIADKLTINLKSSDSDPHYAVLYVSLSMDMTNEDYTNLSEKVKENENAIEEIVTEEFGKYTMDEVNNNKEDIKANILTRIQELFNSDFIINVSFGNIILQ